MPKVPNLLVGYNLQRLFYVLWYQVYVRNGSVVRLLPLVNPKASDLLPITVQVIKDIEQFGLLVDVIVSDNYPLNVNLFKLLGNSKEILSRVQHPNNNQRSLYLMFDFVHIIKTIRNNWLNQKDFNCTYIFLQLSN